MGTRSDNIVHRTDSKWARIYCHWDGYLEHNGKILFEHYNSQEQAEALVALGHLSSLAETIGKKHDFDWHMNLLTENRKRPEAEQLNREDQPEAKMCNFYGRDRGETEVDAKAFDSLNAAWPGDDCGTEFTYVFEKDRWYVGNPDEGSQSLVQLSDALDDPSIMKTAIKAFGGNFVIGHR